MADQSLASGKKMAHQAHQEGQQHPIKLYLIVWGWLFVLSTCSYLVDYFGLQGQLRWFLILLFMIVKAGLIVAVFMHMAFERLALMYAILVPPGAVLLFVAIMAFESDYTHLTRVAFFGTGSASTETETFASAKPGPETGTATTPPAKPGPETGTATTPPAKPGPETGTAATPPAKPGPETGTAATPPAELKNEAEKHGLDVSKPEVVSEGRNVALSGSAAATGEAGKTAPAGGNTASVATVQNDSAAAAKAPESKFYTLKPGDTLWKVAEAEYGLGHGGKFHLIFEANKSLLSDPRKVHPGQVLRIPPYSG
jgi:cytochrome c oxidase subunit IV/LysM repeat protein